MQAIVFDQFGHPDRVCRAKQVPIPSIGPDQVLIKVKYSPIHNHNWLTVAGLYGVKPALPHIDGTEAVGYIHKLGSNVSNLELGQRVAVAKGSETWAEYFAVDAPLALPIPAEIDDVTASQFLSMPLSALMLIDFLGVKRGEWFIYNGANGLVGKVLAQVSKDRGINMLKIVRRESAKKELERLGFSDIAVYPDPEFDSQVRRIVGETNEKPDSTSSTLFKAAVDNVGGEIGNKMLEMLCNDGLLCIFGRLTEEPTQLSSRQFIYTKKRCKGFWVTPYMKTLGPEQIGRYQHEALKYFTDGTIKLSGNIIDFGNIKEAMEAHTREKDGKVILKWD